ncbi:MAG: nitroreductase family protein [Bacteroidaceae bacterium]
METNLVLDTIRRRRSVRSYSDRPVEREKLEAIVEAATWAPTGMNRRTFHFLVVTDAGRLQELNRRIRAVFRQSELPSEKARGDDENYVCYYNAPALIIASNEPSEAWAAQDCACALQNIFLSARSLGVDSCWINQLCKGMSDEPRVYELLRSWGMPEGHKVYGCAALGYGDRPLPEGAPRKEGLVTWVE